MIKTRHTEIRAEMMRHGYDGRRLATVLDITAPTLSAKLCGHTPWTSREMYIIMDLLDLPYDKLNTYFPKNGISDVNCYRALPTDLPMQRRIKAV
jgi:hypothetical protein